jgi:MFS family permease
MPEPELSTPGRTRLTPVQWIICIVAIVGFAFDIYELLMLPLIVRPALLELAGHGVVPGTPEFGMHVGRLFYIPAVAGGLFGLLGGWLIDRLGRRRVLVWSVMIYSLSPLGAAFSTTVNQLLFFRCTTFIGVSVEFVAAVAWLAELFPDPKQREKVLGFTQAFSSFGGIMIAFANGLIISYADQLPALGNVLGTIDDPHAPWRYTLVTGLIPAIPIMLLLPFLPESPMWQQKHAAGTLKRPRIRELFSPELRRTTLVTTLMFAMCYGAAFGALQQIPRIIPGVPEVKQEIAEKTRDVTDEKQKARIRGLTIQANAANITKVQELGGLVGRVLLAFLIVLIVSRRRVIRLFQVPGLVLMPVVFVYAATTNINYFYIGAFLAGLLTVGQFSFWGNYLPRVYPLHLRGTGQSFAANIGGRMFGTFFAMISATIAVQDFVPGKSPAVKLAYTAAAVGFAVYLVGFIASFWLPEPETEELPE